MDHGLLTRLYQENKDNTVQRYIDGYLQFIEDAYLISSELERNAAQDTEQEKIRALFYQMIGFCEMIWHAGGEGRALRDSAYVALLRSTDSRLQMMEEMQQELSRCIQDLLMRAGGIKELIQAGFALQNHSLSSLMTLKAAAKENDAVPEGSAEKREECEEPMNAQLADTDETEEEKENAAAISAEVTEESWEETVGEEFYPEDEKTKQYDLRELFKDYGTAENCLLNDTFEAILDLDPSVLPETVKLGDITMWPRRDLENIRQKAFDIAAETFAWYKAEDDSIHYLNRDEIDHLGTQYLDLNADLLDLCEVVETEGITDFPMEVMEAIREALSNRTTDLFHASAFAIRYIAKHDKSSLRVFSIYDLMGEINPNCANHLMQYALLLQNIAEDIPDNETAEQVADEVTELVEIALPRFLRDCLDGKLFDPIGADELGQLGGIYREADNNLKQYLDEFSAITEKEKEFQKALEDVRVRVAYMADLCAMLGGSEEGERLSADIDQYIESVMNRQQQAEEGTELKPFYYQKEEAARLRYAMDCRQMAEHDALAGVFLFGDPHALQLLAAGFNIEILEEVEMREQDISAIPWTEGMRDLSDVAEYRMRLDQDEDMGHILQYATKNDWEQFYYVVNESLKYLPAYMKKVKILVSGAQKGTTSVREINVGEMVRMELESWQNSGETILTQMESMEDMIEIVRRNAGAFSFEDPQDGERVVSFLERLKRNLENAGFGVEAQRALADPSIPDGYNESAARMNVSLLFGNLNRTIRHQLLPEEKIVLAKDRSRKDRYMDVTLSYARGNADVNASEEGEFYTTTEDFRLSDFVGEYPGSERNMELIKYSLEGMGEQETMEVFSGKRKNQFGYVTDRRIDDARTVVRRVQEEILFRMQQGVVEYEESGDLKSEDTFAVAEHIADMADLQVIDYITGVRLRSVDDLRLAFRKDDKGMRFCGITGADRSTTRPFTRLSEEDEKRLLIQPENMRVMTKEMYEKLLHWKKGLEELNGIRLSDVEKDLLSKIDPEVSEGARRRLLHLLSVTEDPQETVYADKKRKMLGWEYTPDLNYGKIRVLERKAFAGIRPEDLSGEGDCSQEYKAQNLFDVMAELSQKCSDALLDKLVAFLAGTEEKKFGKGLGILGEAMYHEQKRVYDLAVNNQKAERICLNAAHVFGDVFVMAEEARQNSNALTRILDGPGFQKVEDAAKVLRESIEQNHSIVVLERRLAGGGDDLSAEELERIDRFRGERLAYAQMLADAQGHSYPEEAPPVTMDPHLYFLSLQAMDVFCRKLREYLEKRRVSVNESIREMIAETVKIFNHINQAIAAYAAVTGDTSVMPVRASVNDEKLCSVTFADVFDSVAEYENTTPYYYDTEKKKQESLKKNTYTVVKRSDSGNEDGSESNEGHSTTVRSGDQRTRIGLNDLMKESGRKG